MRVIHKLRIREQSGVDRQDEVLVWGVPIAPAVAVDPATLILADAKGRRLPMQADVQARWADGSIKWVLLTAPRMRLAAGRNATLSLGVGAARRRPPLITLTETAEGIRVVTDMLRFHVNRSGPLVSSIERRTRGRWSLLAPALDLSMTVERENSLTHYLASLAGRTVQAEVSGPLRCVIAIRGIHQSADGRTFGPYVLRIEIIGRMNQVRLTHSFVFDADPEQDFVRASEILISASVGPRQRMTFGGDSGHEVRMTRQAAVWCPDYRHAELFQDSATHWRVRRWVDPARRDIFCEEGLQSDGWMELAGDEGRLAVAVREFWENHPKSLAGDAEAGQIRVGLYPSSAERLNLTRYSDRSYMHTYEAPCTWKKETMPFDQKFNARGIRKTHDLALFLGEPNPSRSALHYNQPLMVSLPLPALARTRVLAPTASRVHPAWLRRFERYLDFLGYAMRRDGGTGYVDYFDLPMGFNTATGRWHHDYGGLGYINDEAMPCLGLWQMYFLTGRGDAFKLARAMARHNSDIDSHHAGPWAGRGSRHNVNHWGDMDKEERISQPVGKRFLHYVTGDRSILDLVETMLLHWERLFARPQWAGMVAQVPSLVSTLLVAEETGMRNCEAWLRSLAGAVAGAIDKHGRLAEGIEVDAASGSARPYPDAKPANFMMLSCFGGVQTFAELAERYDHAALRSGLVRMARHAMRPFREREALNTGEASSTMPDSLNAFRALDLFGYAYAVTKDPAFARHVRRHARHVAAEVVRLPQSRYGIAGRASRPAPFCPPWPDMQPARRRAARQYYPLFAEGETSQFFEMAVYMHKAQALMLLLAP